MVESSSSSSGRTGNKKGGRPANVVVIMADDLGWNEGSSCSITTPHFWLCYSFSSILKFLLLRDVEKEFFSKSHHMWNTTDRGVHINLKGGGNTGGEGRGEYCEIIYKKSKKGNGPLTFDNRPHMKKNLVFRYRIYRVFIKYCVFFRFLKNIPDSDLSLFSLGVSVV